MGGFMGMIGVYGLSFVVNYFLTLTPDFNFTLVLSWSNMAYGLFFSILTGILAGIIPAWFGAKMPPVEAIRAS
jgi:putative ABC transport system permease protein